MPATVFIWSLNDLAFVHLRFALDSSVRTGLIGCILTLLEPTVRHKSHKSVPALAPFLGFDFPGARRLNVSTYADLLKFAFYEYSKTYFVDYLHPRKNWWQAVPGVLL